MNDVESRPSNRSASAAFDEHETEPSAFTPATLDPVGQLAVIRFWNAVESRLSNRSALRLATLVAELTVSGVLPAATVSCSAVAPVAVEALLTCSAGPP